MTTKRLTIELDEGALPRGRILMADGGELSFAGWVQLAAAIDEARGAAPRRESASLDLSEPALQPPSPQG
jgi:hypothetical protein